MMYRLGKATNTVKFPNGYGVVIWEDGHRVFMCEYSEEKKDFVPCVFPTIEDAKKEMERYNELSWDD